MSRKNDSLYLGHMLEAARWIVRRLATMTRQEFDADEDLQLAVAHQLQIIGEAARCVSEAGRQRAPGIPWRLITGMRHRIVHDYVNIDFETVWKTSTQDIHPLVTELERLLPPTPP